ncbi:uncharacterized protein LOC124317146 [Daphnia pulicaria]|uniref:uncharacterized protein LOC124317146 n=1 Tax=Daphnia pulicaria TaxID=35523 RepID=UPI001EEA6EDA|nr:uncharacterized protein LOC124317146 [Daphnia pulicaria]XP_046638701.1 uncharacterized protein LOC124317146 [Daphnia pulicaria]
MMANLLMFLTAAFLISYGSIHSAVPRNEGRQWTGELAEPIDCSFPLNVERNSTTSHNSPIERVSFCHKTTNGPFVDGTLPSGARPSGERQLDSYCDAWTSSDAKTLGVAASLIAYSPSHQQQQQTGGGGGGGGKLLAQNKFSCQNRFVVLCIEATSQGVATSGSGRVKRTAEHIISEDHYQAHLQSLF